MNNRERVIEIAEYLDETEYACKRCGSVNHVSALIMEFQEQAGKKGQFKVKGSCPDCESYLKFLPTAKDILFPYGKYKGTLCNDLPIDYVVWMLGNARLSNNLKKRLELRVKKALKGKDTRFEPKKVAKMPKKVEKPVPRYEQGELFN